MCRGPINEDVFSAPAFTEEKIMDSDIQEITEQIERLILQVKSPHFADIKTHALEDVKVVHF